MADEKRNDQIVDSNELSEQELEQATGGVTIAAVHKAEGDRAQFAESVNRRRK
jgi:hypothetical protein